MSQYFFKLQQRGESMENGGIERSLSDEVPLDAPGRARIHLNITICNLPGHAIYPKMQPTEMQPSRRCNVRGYWNSSKAIRRNLPTSADLLVPLLRYKPNAQFIGSCKLSDPERAFLDDVYRVMMDGGGMLFTELPIRLTSEILVPCDPQVD